MIIAVFEGEAGSGKSIQAGNVEENIICYDMENRWAEYEYDDNNIPHRVKKPIYFSNDNLIEVIPLKRYYPPSHKDAYKEDKVSSFEAFVSQVSKTLKSVPPTSIIVDGVSDLRDYAGDKWLTYAKTKDGKPRKQAQNPGDFEEINDLVRNELFPLINWARIKSVNLIFTAQMKDNYQKIRKFDGTEESAKDGRIADYKDWFGFNIDLIANLWQPIGKNKKPEGRYMVTVTKAPPPIGSFEEDITGKNLFDVLQARGL